MVHRCVVKTCSTTQRCTPEGVKLHRFPTATDRLNAWIHNIQTVNGTEWTPTSASNARICSLHFTSQSYELERQDGLIKLRWNAVPTIFVYPNNCVSSSRSTISTITSDHLYSVAREQAARQEEENCQRKVLENIMNSRIPDHVYASSYEAPLCKIGSTQCVERQDCDVIDVEEDTSDSIQEIAPQSPVKTCLIKLADGRVAQLLSSRDGCRLTEKTTFTDSEVDKIQIRQLSEENRKLEAELSRVRRLAEKLLGQNERLRQQNRAYLEKLEPPFNEGGP